MSASKGLEHQAERGRKQKATRTVLLDCSVFEDHFLLENALAAILERAAMLISRLTMDFDGSVTSTGRFAEGTAVGFNKQKKGR